MKDNDKIITVPNIITSLRLLGTVVMIFTPVFSLEFFLVYTFCGFTDVLDGFIARRWNLTSRFGAKLDSIADLTFYAVMIAKVFPFMWRNVAKWIWIIIGTLFLIRLLSYTLAWKKYGEFSAMHTYMNKASGFAVFAVPYFLHLAGATAGCCIVCAVVGIGTLEELTMHVLNQTGHPLEVKTILQMKRN